MQKIKQLVENIELVKTTRHIFRKENIFFQEGLVFFGLNKKRRDLSRKKEKDQEGFVCLDGHWTGPGQVWR